MAHPAHEVNFTGAVVTARISVVIAGAYICTSRHKCKSRHQPPAPSLKLIGSGIGTAYEPAGTIVNGGICVIVQSVRIGVQPLQLVKSQLSALMMADAS